MWIFLLTFTFFVFNMMQKLSNLQLVLRLLFFILEKNKYLWENDRHCKCNKFMLKAVLKYHQMKIQFIKICYCKTINGKWQSLNARRRAMNESAIVLKLTLNWRLIEGLLHRIKKGWVYEFLTAGGKI